MKATKRISAMLLALVMVFSLVPAFFGYEAAATISMDPVGSKCTITFTAGSGTGSSYSATYDINSTGSTTLSLPSAISLGFKAPGDGYVFDGWKIGSSTYSSSYTFRSSDAKLDSQYYITATAQWSKDGSGSGSSSSGKITGTYTPGEGTGSKFTETYRTEAEGHEGYYVVTFPDCPFKKEGYKFDGWKLEGEIYDAGDQVGANGSFTAVATWKKSGIVIGGDGSSSSSSSSSSSKPSSSSSSSAASSSKPSSSSSSSSKPSSSSSSSSKPSSSSSSSVPSSSSSESSSSESSSSSSSTASEQPPIEEFTPVNLAYNISGDVPVTGIEFLLNEDIGGSAQLWISALDSYSAVDDVTSDFISSGIALAAFDLSILKDGSTYHGPAEGTVTYALNGTQANASSNFDEYVTALVHVISEEDYSGRSYYMADGKKAYLYDVESGSKSEVGNMTFAENNGVYRPVLSDINGLSEFAYLAKDGIVVEVALMPDANASSVSIDVTSFSPILLVQLEIGEASSGIGVPVWAWIVIGALVLLIVAFVALFLYNRSNQNKASSQRKSAAHSSSGRSSSGITGLDDDF